MIEDDEMPVLTEAQRLKVAHEYLAARQRVKRARAHYRLEAANRIPLEYYEDFCEAV